MKKNNWLYFIKYNNTFAETGSETLFNPASLNKIFYAIYLLDKYSLDYLRENKMVLGFNYWRVHRKGTQKLKFSQIRRRFSLLELLEFALRDSCNIATAMLADYCGRGNVNAFIKEKLGLNFTHLPARGIGNESTLAELAKTLELVAETNLLTKEKRDFLLEIMLSRTTEAFIKPELVKNFRVYSKGGTTFTGQKRDMAIVQNRLSGKFGYVIFSDERDLPLPKYNLFDKLLAKQNKGKLHKHLRFVESSFGKYVAEKLSETINNSGK